MTERAAPTLLEPRSGVAEVVRVVADRRLLVRLGEGPERDASVAVLGYEDPRPGDRVLVMTDDDGSVWAVGVVAAPRPRSLLDDALEASEPTVIKDRRGRVLFEYDPHEDRAVLHVPSGDLEVSVPDGALRMHARDGVDVRSDGELSLGGARRVTIESGRGEAHARVAMEAGEMSLAGALVAVAAGRAELLASHVGIQARTLDAHVRRVRTVAEVVDQRAGRIIERARDVYREVSGLSQTRAGRLRLVAEKAAQLVGQNTLVKARERMKVKGERIHLA